MFTDDFVYFVLFSSWSLGPGIEKAKSSSFRVLRRLGVRLEMIIIEHGKPRITIVEAQSICFGVNLLQDLEGTYPSLH